MSRFWKYLGLTLAALFLLAALAAGYLLSGVNDAQTRVSYLLDLVDAPAGWVRVTITLKPSSPAPFSDLYLREPVQSGRQRISGLRVMRGGQPLATWQALPGLPDVIRVWNGFSTQPLTITYQADPLWYNGPDSPRSYLGSNFAYLRGMLMLYTPLSLNDILNPADEQPGIDSGFADLQVRLPAGWKMVSPFGSEAAHTPAANLRNAYFGFGPFAISDLMFGKTAFLLGVYDGLEATRQAELHRQIPILFETMQKTTGFLPVSRTCYWSLSVLPGEPIHGAASGTGSLVAQDDIELIAHEMFHWWNGATLVTTPDANWLKEGFTSYYAARALRDSAIWDEARYQREIDSFSTEILKNGTPDRINLVEASRRLVEHNDSSAYDAVYDGGALLAALLDQRLTKQGQSLSQIWPALSAFNRPVSSADFLTVLEKIAGPELTGQVRDIVNGRAPITNLQAYSPETSQGK